MRSSRVVDIADFWMIYNRVCGRDIAEWLEHLAVIANVATVLGSIPESFDTEGRQMKQGRIKQ
jgi:hypothetical protein